MRVVVSNNDKYSWSHAAQCWLCKCKRSSYLSHWRYCECSNWPDYNYSDIVVDQTAHHDEPVVSTLVFHFSDRWEDHRPRPFFLSFFFLFILVSLTDSTFRYDARLLLDTFPRPMVPMYHSDSATGWSDLPSDTEDMFLFTPLKQRTFVRRNPEG